MAEPPAPEPFRILRSGIVALVLSIVFFWAGTSLDSFAGFGFTIAALGSGAVGIGLILAAATEYVSSPDHVRQRTPPHAGDLGRCGICHQRRIQRTGLVVCPTCDQHLMV
jgi:hypothetical protein